MKKKYGLIKVLSVMLLLVVVCSYFIKGRQGEIAYLALGDVFLNYLQSFYYFFDTALFILAVGGFYGVLNKIPAYKRMLEGIVEKVGDKRRVFVIVVTILMALVSSLTGLNTILLVIIPMFISIILLLGYDKLVAISSVIGGVIVGLIGGVFLTVKDPNSYYALTYTTIDKLVGMDGHFANVLPKVLLLVLSIGLLVWYILSYIKRTNAGREVYELSKGDVLYIDTKVNNKKRKAKTEEENEEVEEKKPRVWPLAILLVLLFIILVLGYLPWVDLFKLDIFNKFHEWLLGLKIGNYEVMVNVISSSLTQYGAFGTWAGMGNYMMVMFVMVIFSIILVLGYRVKFDDLMDGFIYGIKKMIPASLVVALAYTVLVCSYNNGFIETLITMANDSFGDNALIHSGLAILGSVFSVDLYYASASIFATITSNLTESANLAVYATMFQSLFGIVQIIGPTSLLLLVGLSYLEVPYKTWIKYIWRFVVELLIIILLVLMIVSLL